MRSIAAKPSFTPMLIGLFVIWPVRPAELSGQAADFFAPGAVSLLEQGDVEAFPDNVAARRWVLGFNTGVQRRCGDIADIAAASRLAGVSVIDGGLNVSSYMTSALPQATEGEEDGERYARDGCRAAAEVLTVLTAIVFRNGGACPKPGDIRAFAPLVSSGQRAELGIDAGGLTRADRTLADELTPGIERYLRTRQNGTLSDATFSQLAGDVARLVVTSGMTAEVLESLRTVDEEGREVVRLAAIQARLDALRDRNRPGNPFQRGGGSGGGRLGCEQRALLALISAVNDALPPALESAFSSNPTNWTQPAAGTTGVVRGRITDGDGAPLRGLEVRIRPAQGNSQGRDPYEDIAPVTETDEEGWFTFPEVPSGQVMVVPSNTYWDGEKVTGFWWVEDRNRLILEVVPGGTVTLEIRTTCRSNAAYQCGDGNPEHEHLYPGESEIQRMARWSRLDQAALIDALR